MEKKTAGNIREYSLLGIVVIGVYIGFKYLSPLAAPFLFAFAFVAALHPMLERVQNKYHIKKGILAAGILLLFCVTVGVGVWCLIVFVIQKLGDLFGQIDLFEEKFCDYHNCKETHNSHDILYISYRFVHNPGNYLNLEIFDENIHPLHNKPLDSCSIHPKLLLNPITAISNKNAEFLLK